MPWRVGKRASCPANKPWAVIKEANNKVVACHPSREHAIQQLKALYANEPSARK